jgi:hypothetical protein
MGQPAEEVSPLVNGARSNEDLTGDHSGRMVLPYEDGHAVLELEKSVAGLGGQDRTHSVEKSGREAERLQRRNTKISPLRRDRSDDTQHYDDNEQITPLRHGFSPPPPKPENLPHLFAAEWSISIPSALQREKSVVK